jgi:ribosomal protein L11 methyltransferase
MGFGTGHHASTRLCLGALQMVDLAGAFVLDVGTGSGVLAIAARRLGARAALGIDSDPDAIQSASESLRLNVGVTAVRFLAVDLNAWADSPNGYEAPDVITANLTGASLVRSAGRLTGALKPGGYLIVSGVTISEQSEVLAAFAPGTEILYVASEQEWVGLLLRKTR